MIDDTKRVLAEMLTENTGRHFLDSGGAYGRNWERNQGLTVEDFDNAPSASLEIWSQRDGGCDPMVTVNVFHWCADRLTYDPAMDQAFQEYAETRPDDGWLTIMEDFATEIRGGSGLYGDGEPFTENTYNHEENLSQTLQFTFWRDPDGDSYVLLQIHGGCDVRGGYTNPRAFMVTADDDVDIFDFNVATIYAEASEPIQRETLPGMPEIVTDDHAWDTRYNGATFQPTEGWKNVTPDRPLAEYDVVESDDDTLRGVIRSWDGKWYSPINGVELHPAAY